jgi:hypothetical protein
VSRDTPVGIVSRPQAGQPKVRGSIPNRGKGYFSHTKRSDRFWGPPSVLFSGICLHGVYRDKFAFTEGLFLVNNNDEVFMNCK